MDIVIYATLCAEGEEHDTAYRLLREALFREFGMAAIPDIDREQGGKPFFPDFPEIHFNISHSYGAAVVALHDNAIGIDVEKLRPAPKRLSAGKTDEEFFRLWTAQEATVKRRGSSIAAVLRGNVEIDSRCRVYDDVLPGYFIAVCPSSDGSVCIKEVGEGQL